MKPFKRLLTLDIIKYKMQIIITNGMISWLIKGYIFPTEKQNEVTHRKAVNTNDISFFIVTTSGFIISLRKNFVNSRLNKQHNNHNSRHYAKQCNRTSPGTFISHKTPPSNLTQ